MPPAVHSYDPNNGEPGTRIEVGGAGFVKRSTQVTFFGGVPGDQVQVDDADILYVDVPEGAATGVVTVTTPGGAGMGPVFTVNYPPVRIMSFQPTHGGASTYVTIRGVGFTGGTRVNFGNQQAVPVRWESDGQIVAAVPVGARPGRVKIHVLTPHGNAASAKDFEIER
jgi:IPT/TIG domain